MKVNKNNVKKNTIFNAFKSLFGIIYPLITFPYISRILMAENVGKINFGNSIVSYFTLIASLGISTYAIRECSRYRDNKDKLSDSASQILSINIISSVVAYIALFVTLVFAKSLASYRTLIIIQSSTILFTTLGADWLNTAMEDFGYIAVRTIGMQILSLVLMFIFVRKPEDYLKYACISVLASSGANIINIFYRRKFCKIRFTLKIDWKRHLPPIILMFSMMLAQTIYTSSDTTILGLYKGDFEVGLYSTSVKIYNIVNSLVASVALVVMPQLSKAFAESNYNDVNKLLKYALNFIVILGLPCIVGLNAISDETILLIAGEEYIKASLSLRILTISLAFSFIGGWLGNIILIPSGKEKYCLISNICSAVLNIVLNLIFIPKWGLYAAAATTAASECVGVLIISNFADRSIKIDNLGKMLVGPACGSIGIVLASLVVRIITSNYYLIAILTIIFGALVYFIILVLMKDEFTLNYIRPILNKLRRQ